MKKSLKERRAFLDRIERKYKEKLETLDYIRESERLSQQLTSVRGLRVDQVDDELVDMLELARYKLSAS